jgi:uroporphyrinogen-III synthase
MGTELTALVERWSGVPYWVPAVREVDRDQRDRHGEVGRAISWLTEGAERLVVLQNGAGVEGLFRVAVELGRAEELTQGLARAETVCRGPKPIAALKTRGLSPSIRVEEPYTTRDLLRALEGVARRGREVLVVHYGERNEIVVQALARARAKVRELSLYEWELPEDLEPLARLVDEIIEGRVGVVAFTSQIQARHLVMVAERRGLKKELLRALRTHTPAAAIGPTCAEALEALGIPPRIVPPRPKMGPLVQSVVRYVTEEQHRSTPA